MSWFQRLVEEHPDAIAVHRDGVFLYANPAMARIFGYDSPDELVGLPILSIVHPDDHEMVRTRIAHSLETGTKAELREERLVRPDGTDFMAEVMGMPIDYDTGPALLVIGRDITDRLAMEEGLRRADRLASLGTLAAGVAHEINNPLAFAAGGAELSIEQLQRLNLSGRDQHVIDGVIQRLQSVVDATARIATIVQDLKLFVRPQVDPSSSADLDLAVERALELVSAATHARAHIELDMDVVRPAVLAPAHLVQVLVNLLLNAAHAIEPGGRIVVRSGSDADETVFVEVEDDGHGMSPEVRERLFEPYFTTRSEGIGLGMWVSHSIVTAAGGSITVQSEEGAGTTVRLTLPAASHVEDEPTRGPASLPPAHRRVIIVDDEPDIVDLIATALQDMALVEGFSVPEYALARLQEAPAPDVVLCDLVMPGLSGVQLYRKAPEDLRDRFVFLTGGAYRTELRAFLDEVDNRVLVKPFRLDQLREVIG